MGKKIKGWVPPEDDEVVVDTPQENTTQEVKQPTQQWTPPEEDEVIEPVKKKDSTSLSVSSSDSKDPGAPSGKNTPSIQLSEQQKRDLPANVNSKTRQEQITAEFNAGNKKIKEKEAHEFVTGEKESDDVISSFTKTIQSGLSDQIPKEYYAQRLRMSKGDFTDLYDSRSDINQFGGDKFHQQLPEGTSIGEFKEWSLKQPSAVKSKNINERAKIFLTEKLGAKGFEDLKSKFNTSNTEQRIGFEKNIEEQDLESGIKLQGVVQDLKSIKGASDFLSFAGNMVGQALYRAPINIATGPVGAVISESAAVYDRQIDLIAEREGISREDVIKKGLDKPAEGQAIAVLSGTLDAASEFNIIGLFKKAVQKEITSNVAKQFAKGFVRGGVPESLTEAAQGELEEFAASKGAEVEYHPDGWRIATSAVGGLIGGGLLGGGTNIKLSPEQQARPTNEFVSEQIDQAQSTDDIPAIERAADAIDAKVQAADENTITKEPVKEEEVIQDQGISDVPPEITEETINQEQDAIQEQRATQVLPSEQGGTGIEGGERGGVEQVQQGKGTTGESVKETNVIPADQETQKEVDQKSGGIIPRPKNEELVTTDKSVDNIKDILMKSGKIKISDSGDVTVKQNSGHPSQLFKELEQISGSKEDALNQYLHIKDDEGAFKKKFGDWENSIMKDYSRSGNEYKIKTGKPKESSENSFAWVTKDENDMPIITFNPRKVRRDSDFPSVKNEYLSEEVNKEQGDEDKVNEYKKLYGNAVNKLRDLKLHLIHQVLFKKKNGTVTIDDKINSLKEVERLNSIELAKDYYGEPMIFMHSGKEGITQFKKPGDEGYKKNDPLTGTEGLYFSRDTNVAQQYSGFKDKKPSEGKDIYYTILKTKNPYYITDPRAQSEYPLKDSKTFTKKDVDALKKLGYDSVIWDKEGVPKHEMVVFDPSQVEIIGSYRDGLKLQSDKTLKNKSLLNRAHKGTTDDKVKSSIEKHGLNYEVESHDNAEKAASKFIKDVGFESAIDAVRKNKVDDGAAAFIWAKAIDDVGERLSSAKTPSEVKELTDLQAELIDEFDKKARSGGRFISALQDVYRSSDFGYKADYQVKKYKEINNGKIPKEVEEKFVDLEKRLKEANDKIKKLEETQSSEASIQTLKSIRQDAQAQKENRIKVAKAKKEKIDDFFDSLKVKKDSGKLNSITQVIGESVWNGSIEVMRKAVLAGVDVATAIQSGIDYINEHYRGNDFNEDDFRALVQPGIERILPSATDDIKLPSIKNGKLVIPSSLIRKIVESGVSDINELTENIHSIVKETLPDITPREVRDAITKYGETRSLSQDDINTKIRELKRVGKLVSALEDVQNKLRPLRSGLQRDKLTDQERRMQRGIKEAMKDLPVDQDEVDQAWKNSLDAVKSRLKNQISDLEDQIATGAKTAKKKGIEYDEEANALKDRRDELKKALQETEGKQALSDEQKTRNAVSAVKRTIDEYQRRIDEKDFSPKAVTKTLENEELKSLRESRDKLKEEYKKLEQDLGVADKKRLENYKKTIKKSIGKYDERIKNSDFTPPVKKKPVALDEEANALKIERDKIKAEFDIEQEKARLKNRKLSERVWDTTVDVWNIPKSLLASIDMSAPFRQGALLSVSNPKAGAKSFVEMFRQAFSEKKANEWLLKIKESPEYQLMKDSKLYLAEPNTKLTAKEEQFLSNFAGRIPIIGRLVKGSERAYSGYLNKLRVDVFANGADRLMDQGVTPGSNPEAYKAWASFINNATGRGNLGALENAATVLNGFFFSPRYLASRINLLNPVTYAKMPKEVRMMALKDVISYAGLGVLILTMAAAAGADVEHDPRSSDFGKIKIGNTRYDIWAGFQQVIRFIAQLTTGEKKSTSTGKIIKLDGSKYPFENRGDVAARFARTKLSPSAGTAVNLLTGKDIVGNDVKIEDELVKNVIPLYLQDITSIYQSEGPTGLLETMVPSFFGIGVQNYSTNKNRK